MRLGFQTKLRVAPEENGNDRDHKNNRGNHDKPDQHEPGFSAEEVGHDLCSLTIAISGGAGRLARSATPRK